MKKYLNLSGLLFVIILSFLNLSCNSDDIEIGDIKNVKLKEIKSDQISLNITVPIKNPNNFKILIKKYNLVVKIKNQEFNLVENNNNIKIPKQFNGTITFPIKLKNNKIFSIQTITNLYKLFSSKKAEIEVIGTIKVRVLMIPKKFTINKKNTVNF